MVELSSFITQALLDIIEGVKEAQERSDVGVVVPSGRRTKAVEFEVSVLTEETKDKQAKIGVFNSGANAKVSTESRQASVLKFSVPLKLPASK